MAKSSLVIGLLGHSANSANLGIGALTLSQIAIVSAVARAENLAVSFKILGWRDPGPVYVTGENVSVVGLRGRDLVLPSGLYAAVRGCDLVLDISAGDSFADIYGRKRFLYNALGKLVVLAARRPLVLSPQTIGPFRRRSSRMLARFIMRMARQVVTRDDLSTHFAESLGLGGKLVEASDVAFRLPYERPKAHAATPLRIGINISGLLFNGGYTRDNMFALAVDYPELARALIAQFRALPDCEVHLIGHVNSERHKTEDDYRVAQMLSGEFPGVVLAPRFSGPSEAKSYIAGMDFFIGSRMHACIAAFSSGVPVLPIAYSRKFAGVFGTLGYHRSADCKASTNEHVLRTAAAAFDLRAQLKGEVAAGQAEAERRLGHYDTVLRTLIRQIAGRPA